MPNNGDRDHNDSTAEPTPTSEIPDVSLSLNAILEVLAHHHRREILRLLKEDPDHTANIGDIISHLINHEANRTGERPGRDQIEIAVHHTHLPKLTSAGIVEYDTRSKELRYWHHENLEDLLDDLHSYEPA